MLPNKNAIIDAKNYDEEPNLIIRKKESKTKKEIIDITIECYENTTIHGFRNIIKADNIIIRLVWVIILIAGIGYSVYSNVFLFLAF